MIEFGDLQCPVCKEYAEKVIPKLIEGPVASGRGEARVPQLDRSSGSTRSTPRRRRSPPGEQGRIWNFVELFYRNQGTENSGYVDDDFLEAVAQAAGVPDIEQWNSDRKSPRSRASELEADRAARRSLSVSTAPPRSWSPARTGPRPSARRLSAAPFEAAISQVG